MIPEETSNLGWWSISGESLLKMLQRVSAGEDPDLVYAEAYGNAKREKFEEGDEKE